MTVIQIDIISDYVCAWCYISKRSLEAAMALYLKTYPSAKQDDSFSLTYRPYFLNHHTHPTIPYLESSVPKAELAEKKLAHLTLEQRDALRQKMDRIGQAAGIHFRYGGMVGPTVDAHRLVYVSRRRGTKGHDQVQSRLVEGLLAAYHEQERDIADRATLRQIGLEAGLREKEIDEAWSSGEVARAVSEEQEKYREIAQGKGVPVYIIQGEHRIDGAQDSSDFFEVFLKVKEADTKAA